MESKPERIESVTSNEATEDAQAETIEKMSYSGGSALLDAEVKMEKELDGTAVDHPTATNITENANSDQAPIRTTGAYPPSLEQLDDEGDFSIAADNSTSV